MRLGRSWRTAAVVSLAALALLPACSRRKPAEVNDIVPKFEVNRARAPLGSAIEVTYTWQNEDPHVDALCRSIQETIKLAERHRYSRRQIFRRRIRGDRWGRLTLSAGVRRCTESRSVQAV